MWVKIKSSIIINIFLLSLVFLVGYGALRGVGQALDLGKEAEDKKNKIEELMGKKGELERYLAELKNAESVKREAKERLNLKEFGETVVVVVPEGEEGVSLQTVEPPTFWFKIKTFVGSLLNF